jgi:ABC-type sugar transport system ATPase subunit
MSEPVSKGIRIRDVHKRYGHTIALDGLSLEIRPGEVLGIAGPNGAGKSTLVRILAGEEIADSGDLTFDGSKWSPTVDWHAVAVVHQEPQLFPNLTVAQNVAVGREGTRVVKPRLREADSKVMEALGIAPFANKLLSECSLATQQRTEIARAVARDSRMFLFDEPNSALTDDESDELFREMHKLASDGRIVLLVTHRLSDLVEHASRVAVIRDGRVRAILEGDALTEVGLARQLVTDIVAVTATGAARAARSHAASAPVFHARSWSHRKAFHNIALEGKPGEILALMGVEGSGARELLRSFAGLERCSGHFEIAGASGDGAIRRFCAYVPATRQLSLYSNFSVGENLLVRLGSPEIAGFGGALKKRRMQRLAGDAVSRFLIKTRTTTQSVRSLSGGNQQKVAIAQALNCAPKLLLLEEPTRGVDIHSKSEIYRLLRDYADAGSSIVIFCTEVLEVYEAADRVRVVSGGALSPSLRVQDYDHVEQLATDITRLERASRDESSAAV